MTVGANLDIRQSRYTNTATFAHGKRNYPCVTMSSAKVIKAYQQEPVMGRINFGSLHPLLHIKL
jgi:hypothetical protein